MDRNGQISASPDGGAQSEFGHSVRCCSGFRFALHQATVPPGPPKVLEARSGGWRRKAAEFVKLDIDVWDG